MFLFDNAIGLPDCFVIGAVTNVSFPFGDLPKYPLIHGGGLVAASAKDSPSIIHPAISDPADASHLTIPFTLPGEDAPYIIDIWLKDDDTLDMRYHDQATTQAVETHTRSFLCQ